MINICRSFEAEVDAIPKFAELAEIDQSSSRLWQLCKTSKSRPSSSVILLGALITLTKERDC